jgi:single-stranded-DNA-specific exonuclease
MADARGLAGFDHFAAPAAPETRSALGVEVSFSHRRWRMRPFDDDIARQLQLSGYPDALAQLLASRGVTPANAAEYLDPKLKHLLPDPCVLANMGIAAERFVQAVQRGETIAVLADYDVDGACGAGLLMNYLKHLDASMLLHVPDRLTEGYGPSVAALQDLQRRGASLLLTVDCGATAHNVFADTSATGMHVIVLDHHAVESNPPVLAHVNPNGPDDRSGLRNLCAAGLAFMFLVAVQRALREAGWFSKNAVSEPDLLKLLDLVALATVADVVPVTGLNRAFVRQGLKRMETPERPAFIALANLASVAAPFST